MEPLPYLRPEAREQFAMATDDGAAESGLRREDGWHGKGLRRRAKGRIDCPLLCSLSLREWRRNHPDKQKLWEDRKPSSWTRGEVYAMRAGNCTCLAFFTRRAW